jgi:monoamine oxidase
VLGELDDERTPDRSFAEFLRDEGGSLSPDDVLSASSFVEGFFAADAERIGERELAGSGGEESAAHSARIPDGYDVILGPLTEGLEVRVGHAVERIEWRPGDVRVRGVWGDTRTSFGPIRSAAAVLTVPLGVLTADGGPSGRPEIAPFPDAWADALGGVAMGDAMRLLLVFDRPVSEIVQTGSATPFDGFLHVPTRRPHVFWTLSPLTDRVLVAWAGGPSVRELPAVQGELVDRTLGVLTEEAGAKPELLRRALLGALWHDWVRDPWSRGAYAYPVTGGTDAPERLSAPVEGTLFLAGEATSGQDIGTVEGAIASGQRAARSVIERLGRAGA